MDKLLSHLGRSGEAESEGAFTISLERAQEKLAEYQLAEPRHYVLNALAAAVAGGASYARCRVSSNEVTLEFDGSGFSIQELESLWSEVLNPTRVRLQEMGVALNGALALKPRGISLISWDGEESHCLIWEEEGWTAATGSPAPDSEPFNRLTVTEGLSLSRFYRVSRGIVPEADSLALRGCLAPLELTLNGRVLSREIMVGSDSASCLAWKHYRPSESWMRVRPPTPEWVPYCQTMASEGFEFEAVLALESREQGAEKGFVLLCNGVLFHRPIAITGVPFVHGVVSADFRKDISHTDLAEDATYRKVIERLTRAAEEMVVDRISGPLIVPESQRGALVAWASLLVERLQLRGDAARVEQVHRWLAEMRFLQDLRGDARWFELLHRLREAPAEERIRSVERLFTILAAEALGALQSVDLHVCRTVSGRLQELGELVSAPWLEQVESTVWLLDGLIGSGAGTSWPREPELSCDMHRLNSALTEALSQAATVHQKAQVLLAGGPSLEILEILEPLLEIAGPDLIEDYCDCLFALKPEGQIGRLLPLRKKAISLRSSEREKWGNFLTQDLAPLARAVMGFGSYVSHRVSALSEGAPPGYGDEINFGFEQALKRLKRGKTTGLITLRSAVLAAERRLSLDSAFLAAVRARAIHLLRKHGHWGEADQVLVRGKVLGRVLRSFQELTGTKSPRSV